MVSGFFVVGGGYRNHGQQDVAGCGGFEGGDGRVDERVDGRCGEDEACGQEADDLCVSVSVSYAIVV